MILATLMVQNIVVVQSETTIRFVWECKIIKNQLVLEYSIIVIFNDA